MRKITMYRKLNKDGSLTVSPIKMNKPDSTTNRLVADDGMMLVYGDIATKAIDTDAPDLWSEVEMEESEEL